MIADGSLKEVPGIGETMYAKIVQLATTGQLPSYDELRRSMPPGLVALLRMPGPRAQEDQGSARELKIESLADLRAAGESGKIAELKGSARRRRRRSSRGSLRREVGRADPPEHGPAAGRADPRGSCKAIREVIRAEVCGSLRRRAETIGDLDILFSSKQRSGGARRVRQAAAGRDGAGARADQGERAAGRRRSVRPARGRGRQFPFALHYFTGSKAHNIAMRKRALARGLSLNEYALIGRERLGPLQDRGRACSRRWGWPRSRPSCARIPARSRPPRPGSCRT